MNTVFFKRDEVERTPELTESIVNYELPCDNSPIVYSFAYSFVHSFTIYQVLAGH